MRSANSLRDEMDRNKHERKFHFTPGERTNQRNSTLTAVHNSNHFTASWSRSQDQYNITTWSFIFYILVYLSTMHLINTTMNKNYLIIVLLCRFFSSRKSIFCYTLDLTLKNIHYSCTYFFCNSAAC